MKAWSISKFAVFIAVVGIVPAQGGGHLYEHFVVIVQTADAVIRIRSAIVLQKST